LAWFRRTAEAIVSIGPIDLSPHDNCTYFDPSSPTHLAASTRLATVNHLDL